MRNFHRKLRFKCFDNFFYFFLSRKSNVVVYLPESQRVQYWDRTSNAAITVLLSTDQNSDILYANDNNIYIQISIPLYIYFKELSEWINPKNDSSCSSHLQIVGTFKGTRNSIRITRPTYPLTANFGYCTYKFY